MFDIYGKHGMLAFMKQEKIRSTVKQPRPKKVQFPLIISKGPKVDMTNERTFEHVGFP
jgi:hypothetical protein